MKYLSQTYLDEDSEEYNKECGGYKQVLHRKLSLI